jgi:ADP-ribose pyrophosphatase YjhB (NUDIX family)
VLAVSRAEPPNEMALPGGGVEIAESPEAAARRELLEETGHIANRLRKVHETTSPDGRHVHVFRVEDWGVNRGRIQSPDYEGQRVEWLPLDALHAQSSLFRPQLEELMAKGAFAMDLGPGDVHTPGSPTRPPKEIDMSVLDAAKRNAIPSGSFAWPEKRKYPIENAAHVRNAAARLAQAVKQGRIDAATAKKIHARIAEAGKKFGVEVSASDGAAKGGRVHVRADLAPGGALHVRHHMSERAFSDVEGVLLTDADKSDGPVWIQIAKQGAFAGHPAGPFRLDAKIFGEIIANFKATENRRVAIDYEHASEQDPTSGSIPTSGAPAQGWITDLKVRDDGNLWGLVEWLPQAREQIRAGAYRYLSPAIRFGSKDRVTGKPVGAKLSSAALTNEPFLDGMAPLAAKDLASGARSLNLAGKGLKGLVHSPHEYMPAMRSALKLDGLASAKECADKLDRLRDACMSSGAMDGSYQGENLSDYTRPLRDLVGAQPGMTIEDFFDCVEDLIAHAIDQHVEEMHGGVSPMTATMDDDGDPTGDMDMSDKEIQEKLTTAETEVLTLTGKLKTASGDVTSLTDRLTEATTALKTSEGVIAAIKGAVTCRDGEALPAAIARIVGENATLLAEKAKRDEADLNADVEIAFDTYKDKMGLTPDKKGAMLAFAKTDRAAFNIMYPPVALSERHLLRNIVPGEPRDKVSVQMSQTALTRRLMSEKRMPYAAAYEEAGKIIAGKIESPFKD